MRVWSVALALPAFLLPSSGDPVDIQVIDASTLTRVAVDVAMPSRLAALSVTPDMVQVDGGQVLDAGTIDPASSTVTIVLDDTASLDEVTAAQGAAVELVRAMPDGTTVALATPGGRRTPATSDDAVVISEIGAITGAGPSVPLAEVVLAESSALAAATPPDRHIVVVSSAPTADGTATAELRVAVTNAGIRLSVVAPPGRGSTELIELGDTSGGVRPTADDLVAQVDAIARSIRDRVRITLALDGPGERSLALTVGGETLQGTFSAGSVVVPTTGAPTTTVASTTTIAATTTAAPTTTPVPTTVAVPTTAIAPPTVRPQVDAPTVSTPSSRPTAASAEDDGGGAPWALAAISAAVVVVAAVLIAWRRRRTRPGPTAPVPAVLSGPAVTPSRAVTPSPVEAEVVPAVDVEVLLERAPVAMPSMAPSNGVARAVLPWDRAVTPAGHRNGQGSVDLNTACAEELATLPGIGRATADAIVAERQERGSFECVDDLRRVRGIGPHKLDGLRQRVSV